MVVGSLGFKSQSSMCLREGTALQCLRPRVCPGCTLSGDIFRTWGSVAADVQQVSGEVATRPAEGEPSLSDVKLRYPIPNFQFRVVLEKR